MQTTRRHFLAHSVAAVGTSLVVSPFSLRGERIYPTASKALLTLTDSDRDVLAFAGQFSHSTLLSGGGVLSRLERVANPNSTAAGAPAPLALRVSIERLDAWSQSLHSMPFSNVYADGNTLQFTHRGASYEVESLEAASFRTVELDLRAGRLGDLAHDSITWDPATRRLSDPHGVMAGGSFRLSRVAAPVDSIDQVRQWVRGWVDAANHNLEPDAEFRSFHQQVRASTVRDEASAREVAGILISGLAGLHGGAPAATVTAFLGSPLARASLPVVTGEAVSVGIARHQAMERSAVASGAAGWLAAILGPGRLDGQLARELGLVGNAAAFRTRAVLQQAREALGAGSSRVK